jgi:ABC-type polysaccharide/polyol phosphate export permease
MKKWVRSGLVWAGILYVITMVIFPMIDHERFDLEKLLLGLPLWALVGLIIGYLFEKKKHNKKRISK